MKTNARTLPVNTKEHASTMKDPISVIVPKDGRGTIVKRVGVLFQS